MKIPIRRLLLVAACALLAMVVASDGVGHGTSRQSRRRYVMRHRKGCGDLLVYPAPEKKHKKKEPVILSYSPDRADHFLFAGDAASRNMYDFDWKKHREEYVEGMNKGDGRIRVATRTHPSGQVDRMVRGNGLIQTSIPPCRSDFVEGLSRICFPKDSSDEWRRTFYAAISWRYPRDGTMWSAQSYFEDKVDWTRQALHNGSWEAEPTKVLEAAVGVLTEVAEWGFRKDRVLKGILQARASSPFGMPEVEPRKAKEDYIRWKTFALLCDTLQAARLTLAEETWEKCNLMLGEAYRRQDRVGLERLRLLKKRILGSLDEAEREAMLRLMPPADRPPSQK